MAISQFSNPALFNPIQKHINLPVEYLQNNLNMAQHSYDLGQAETKNLVEQLTKSKALEKDKPLLQNISQSYENALNGITDQAHKDLGSSDYRNKIAKLASHLQTNLAQGPLSTINGNYNTYQAYQKQIAENKDYSPHLDSEFTKNNQNFYGGAINTNGTYNNLKLGSMGKSLNLPTEADNIVKGINSISTDTPRVTKDAYGNDVVINDKGEFITPDKIRATFLPAFKNSPAYQEVLQKANYEEALANKQNKTFDKQAYIDNTINDLQNHVISKYTLSKTGTNIDFHNIPEYQQDKNSAPIYTPTRNGAAFTNPNISGELVDPGKNNGMDYLRAIGGGNSKLSGYSSGKIGNTDQSQLDKNTLTKQQLDEAKATFNKNVDNRVATINNLLGKHEFTKTSYIDHYNKAIKNLGNVTLPGVEIQPKQAEVYQQLLNNSKGSRLFNVGGQQMNINQIAEKYDVKPDDIEISPSLIHYDSVDPNQKGGNMEVSLHIKGKEYIPATTLLNDNFTAETGIISQIGQNSIYKGSDTYTAQHPLYDPSKDANIYTITAPKKNFTPGKELPFETTVVIEPRNGESPIRVPYNTFKEIYGAAAVSRLQNTINSSQTIAPKDLK